MQVGDKAPQFTLTSDSLEAVSLSDYSGKNVVLLFFPLAFTGVCTEELCTMRDSIADYEDLDAQILGISVDSPFALQAFKREQSINFPLLSDFNKEVSRNYGAIYEEFVMGMRGVAKRSAFVIDKDGVVRYAEILDNAGEQPDYAKIKAVLSELP
ncbi:MAG: peroxiredoxin [Bacteroidetes bacterium]|nr:MAG: peroxiredoxin [Bacteroidota bacterium]